MDHKKGLRKQTTVTISFGVLSTNHFVQSFISHIESLEFKKSYHKLCQLAQLEEKNIKY